MKQLIIIGAGGHGRVLADCAEILGEYSSIVFLDDCYNKSKSSGHWQIIGPIKSFSEYIENSDFIVAIGNNHFRGKIIEQLKANNAKLISLIHPSAVVSSNASIGNGVILCANATVNVGTRIDDGCIINTGATVDHDCRIFSNVHISPGVNIAGGVTINAFSWLGISSTVIECIIIAENTQVGAGAVVTSETESNSLYLGVPAKQVRSLTIN